MIDSSLKRNNTKSWLDQVKVEFTNRNKSPCCPSWDFNLVRLTFLFCFCVLWHKMTNVSASKIKSCKSFQETFHLTFSNNEKIPAHSHVAFMIRCLRVIEVWCLCSLCSSCQLKTISFLRSLFKGSAMNISAYCRWKALYQWIINQISSRLFPFFEGKIKKLFPANLFFLNKKSLWSNGVRYSVWLQQRLAGLFAAYMLIEDPRQLKVQRVHSLTETHHFVPYSKVCDTLIHIDISISLGHA